MKPGYKQTEVGVIPEDWEARSVSELGNVVTGSTPDTRNAFFCGGDIPWITPSDISHLKDIRDGERGITAAGLSVIRVLPANAVLVTCIASIGKNAVLRQPGACNQQINAVIPIDGNDPDYLYYMFDNSCSVLMANAGITATNIISKKTFEAIRFPRPPPAEQTAIASALGDVDEWIVALEKVIEKKRLVKQGAMQELLTGKRRLPGFDGEWEEKRLGEIAPLQRGFDLPSGLIQDGLYPVVYSNGIMNYHSKAMVKAPGVVTGHSGTLGAVHFIDKDFWPHNTALWVTSFGQNDSRFIFYLYTWIGFERFSSGSGVPTLNRGDAHSFQVSIPLSRAEQTAIATILSDMDAEIEVLEAKLAKARQIKRGMMQALLTGRIRLQVWERRGNMPAFIARAR